jgi:hypothetical protein
LGRNAAAARIIPRRHKNPRFIVSLNSKFHFHFPSLFAANLTTGGSQQSTFIHF